MDTKGSILAATALNFLLFSYVIILILPLVLMSMGKVDLVQFKEVVSFYALYLSSILAAYFLAISISITKKKPCDPKEAEYHEMWRDIVNTWKEKTLLVGLIVFLLGFAFFGMLELFPYQSFGKKELFSTSLLSLTYSAVWVASLNVFD